MLRRGLIAIFVCGSFALPVCGAAPKKNAPKSDPALPTVEKILRAEVTGQVDRRWQLAEVMKEQPHSLSAHWQAGFIKDGDSWRSFDDQPGATKKSEALQPYRIRRDGAALTFSGQLNLANWCAKQDLAAQEQAHLHAALMADPQQEHANILNRLGYCSVGGVWFSPEEMREWQRQNKQTVAGLKRWQTKLSNIAKRLSGSPQQQQEALRQLREIAEPASIPVIEILLAGESERSALVAVDLFKKIDGPDGTLALAKQAVFSNWLDIRQAATRELKTRTPEDFAPALISLLAKPVSAELRVSTNFRDFLFRGPVVLLFSYVMARETQNQFQVATFQNANYHINDYVNGMFVIGETFRASRGNNALDLRLQRGQTDIARETASQVEANARSMAEFNERSAELNGRIGAVLAAVSGLEATPDPETWWKWWGSFSDTQQTAGKAVVEVSEYDVSGNPFSPGITILSCFAAGTAVWTETGPQMIETIKVGDRVLSQDVESGELAYKPVLQTTVRSPKELTTLRFDDETIVCTGGHRFWDSASGWTKARDLAPQTLVHTVTGNTPVWSAKKGTTAETFNLVVSDFHTYFVGKTGVLCQDLVVPRSTNNLIPGLARK